MGSPRVSYVFGAYRLDPVEKVLRHDGVPVSLTPKAFETLLVLVARHGRVVTKEDLLEQVWPDAFVEENNLAQNVSTLRRVLLDTSGERPIETVPKRGYRFVAVVTEQIVAERAVPSAPFHGRETPSSDPSRTAPAEGPAAIESPPAGELSKVMTIAAPPARRRAMVWSLAAVATVLLAVVGISVGRDGVRGWAIGARWDAPVAEGPRAGSLTRVAVLPFANLGEPADGYFVAGMAEEIASRLAGLRHVAVPSSTTINAYDRQGKGLAQIAEDLRVAFIVEGGVRWTRSEGETRVRITPKLIRVADDTTVWSHQYETALADLFSVQAEIALQISSALQVALDERERQAVDTRPTSDTEAYLAYLRGRAAFQQGPSDTANLTNARAALEQAVAHDPSFALAWSWLARVCAWQYRTGASRTQATMKYARGAADRAIALEPGRAESHLGLAHVFLSARDYDNARRELSIAKVGLPNSAELLQAFAWIEQRRGQWRESLSTFMQAFELDPGSTADLVAVHYMHQREYEEAWRFLAIAKAANRAAAVVPEAWTHFAHRGDLEAAISSLEAVRRARSPVDGRVLGLLAHFELFAGRHERALALIGEMDAAGAWLPANFRYPRSLAAAQVYDSLGRRDAARHNYLEALTALEAQQQAGAADQQIEAALALTAAGLGRSADASRHAARALQLLPAAEDAAEGPLYLYLMAQVHARIGDHARAFALLDEMFRLPGFYNERWVQRDPGFASLRREPAFEAAVARWTRQKGEVLLARAPAAPR